jgi:hypothetical protein
MLALSANSWGTGDWPVSAPPYPAFTPRAAAVHYLSSLHGAVNPASLAAVLAGLGGPPDQPMGDPQHPDVRNRIARIAALSAMTPEFQSA